MADTWPVYGGDPRHEKKWLTGIGDFPTPMLNLGGAVPNGLQPMTFGGAPVTPDRGALIFPNRNPSDFSLGTPVATAGDPRKEANAYTRNYLGGQPQGPQYIQTTRDPRAQWLSGVKTFANDILGSIGAHGDQVGLQNAGFFGSSKQPSGGGNMSTMLLVAGVAAAAFLLVKK